MKYIVICIVFLLSCQKVITGHKCIYKLCPYKGVVSNYEDASLKVNGSDDCIDYWMDIYHMQDPSLEDYQLEEKALR